MGGILTIEQAQKSFRLHYRNGGVGVIVSGVVWLISATLVALQGFQAGVISLFIGGSLIFPISLLFVRRSVKPDKSLMPKALMSLPLLFGGLLLAFYFAFSKPSLFYPIVAIAIGLRYFTFNMLYGMKVYHLLAGVLVLVGIVGMILAELPVVYTAVEVAVIEILFGLYILRMQVAGDKA